MNLKLNSIIHSEKHWNSLKGGDGKALEALYHLYGNALHNYGSKFTQDKEVIGECIQQLFVDLWIRRNHISQPQHIKNYLFKVFRHAIFKEIKSKSKRIAFNYDEDYKFYATISIEQELIIGEDHIQLEQRLQSSLDQLSSRQREAIFLKFYEGLSYQEVATIMGISVKATYKLMARSIASMRDKLDGKDFLILTLLLSLKFFN